MRILMHANSLNVRGTTGAMVKYAEQLLAYGHSVTLGYCEIDEDNDRTVIRNLQSRFTLIGYDLFENFLRDYDSKFDFAYFIKAGKNDGKIFSATPSVVHAVFQYFEPHGVSYAYVSKWLAKQVRIKSVVKALLGLNLQDLRSALEKKAWVPHMIDLPEPQTNCRSDYGVPENAILGIRLGGFNTFDIPFVHEAVQNILELNESFWFIFVNTQPFVRHERVIYAEALYGEQDKSDLLNSADFMLHARSNGESFGLALLEAMYLKLPVLAWSGGVDRNHLELLGSHSIYKNRKQLLHKMCNIKSYKDIEGNYRKSLEYLPEPVMKSFFSVFKIQ